MAAYERVTLNRGGRNSRFDCRNNFSKIKRSKVTDYAALIS